MKDKTVTLTTDWQTITWETGLTAAGADGQNFKLYSHPKTAKSRLWIPSGCLISPMSQHQGDQRCCFSSLTGTVTNQGNTLTSQGESITALNNALEGSKAMWRRREADASAVSSLTNPGYPD